LKALLLPTLLLKPITSDFLFCLTHALNKYACFVLDFSMKQKLFTVSRQANYYTLGEPTANEWWILLHGYAQRADEILKDCSPLLNENRYMLAPEGLSRFYREGFSGAIGATWMTSYLREAEIEDYVHYLNSWWQAMQKEGQANRIILLGFSQGVATATRWLSAGNIHPQELILFAGSPAHELDPGDLKDKADNFHFIFGDQDPFFSEADVYKKLENWQGAGIDIRVQKFNGRHRIIPESLSLIEAALG
jgi:predicted esterase